MREGKSASHMLNIPENSVRTYLSYEYVSEDQKFIYRDPDSMSQRQ